jgi:hypothetical protein
MITVRHSSLSLVLLWYWLIVQRPRHGGRGAPCGRAAPPRPSASQKNPKKGLQRIKKCPIIPAIMRQKKARSKTVVTLAPYPYRVKVVFKTGRKLPPFKYGCPIRTKIVRQFLAQGPIVGAMEAHGPQDFIVESILPRPGGEVWFLGS